MQTHTEQAEVKTKRPISDHIKNGIALFFVIGFLGGWAEILVGIWVDPPAGPRWIATGIVQIVLSVAALMLIIHWDEHS